MTQWDQLCGINDQHRERLASVERDYHLFWDDPANCRPMFIMNVAINDMPTHEQRVADPLVMFRAELEQIASHFAAGDDHIGCVRIGFGTAQVAAAFGCRLEMPTNAPPVAATHVLESIDAVMNAKLPSLDAGWYGKLREWTQVWRELLPAGLRMQHPDIQSVFNSAHLIRGNDIFLDIYDAPEAVGHLLDLVADYMIQLVPHLKQMIGEGNDWFADWGGIWKGAARVSQCSMHMISPEVYAEHVYPRDLRFFNAIGGGRLHYCGSHDQVFDRFHSIPGVSGVDYNMTYHPFDRIWRILPPRMALLAWINAESPEIERLLAGQGPQKRNILYLVDCKTQDQANTLYRQLRQRTA